MGDAFRNAGLLTGTVLTIFLGIICLHSQRQLVKCSKKMQEYYGYSKSPDYARTVELCFDHGPPSVKPWAGLMRRIVNMFICLTQMGFCCIYFVFISENLKQVISLLKYWLGTRTIANSCDLVDLLNQFISQNANNHIFSYLLLGGESSFNY